MESQKSPGGNSHQRSVQRSKFQKEAEALAPLLATKLAASSVSGQSRWSQSTLLWGSVGLAVAIVLTVVSAMKHDVRWLLWLLVFAWPFLCIAAWEVSTYFTSRSRWRYAATGILAIVFAISLYKLSVALRPQAEAVVVPQPIPIQNQPNVKISDARQSLATMRAPTQEEISAAQLEINSKENTCRQEHPQWDFKHVLLCVNQELEKEQRMFRARTAASKWPVPRTKPLVSMDNTNHINFYGGSFKGPMEITNSDHFNFDNVIFEPIPVKRPDR